VPAARPSGARDRGAAALVVLIVTVSLASVVLVGLTTAGQAVVEGNRARTAADAVALAGAEHGRDRAAAIAVANGATIVAWTEAGGADGGRTVTVEVVVGDVSARARATTEP
jgi:hypothetical protein